MAQASRSWDLPNNPGFARFRVVIAKPASRSPPHPPTRPTPPFPPFRQLNVAGTLVWVIDAGRNWGSLLVVSALGVV